MKSISLLLTGLVLLGLAELAIAQDASTVRTGRAAYGDWHSDAPGVTRKITPTDLPRPLETPTVANRSEVVPKPADAALKVPEGFTVEPFATGIAGARVIRIAPNGDIFISQSLPGKIVVMHAPDGASKPETTNVFADGLNRPFGIAFYPPGPNPQYVYVGETNQIVRFPYQNGDVKASGKAELIFPISQLKGIGHATSYSRPMARPCMYPLAQVRMWRRTYRRSLISLPEIGRAHV